MKLAGLTSIWVVVLFWWSFLYSWTVFLAFLLSYAVFFFIISWPALRLQGWKSLAAIPLLWLAASYLFQSFHHAGFIGEISVFFLSLPSLGWLPSPIASAALASLFSSLAYAAAKQRKKIFVIPVLLLLVLLIPGLKVQGQAKESILLVQGNFGEDWVWRSAHAGEIFDTYENLSLHDAGLVVWPEYAIADDIRQGYVDRLEKISQGKILIVGHPTDMGFMHFDSASVFRGGGYEGRYDSVAPIFFNEQTEPGDSLYLVDSGTSRYGIVICYEELNRELFREYKTMGADAIISLVNDQHIAGTPGEGLAARFARLRAKEFGMPVFRATNTGLTMAIDGNGIVKAMLEPGTRGALLVPVNE